MPENASAKLSLFTVLFPNKCLHMTAVGFCNNLAKRVGTGITMQQVFGFTRRSHDTLKILVTNTYKQNTRDTVALPKSQLLSSALSP